MNRTETEAGPKAARACWGIRRALEGVGCPDAPRDGAGLWAAD
jgi:hypothetical protein